MTGYAILKYKEGVTYPSTISSAELETVEEYKNTFVDKDLKDSDVQNVLRNKYGVTVNTAEGDIYVRDGESKFTALYDKVGFGDGTYSSRQFVFNADGGPYSLLYKYVGTGGDLNLIEAPYKYVSNGFDATTGEFVAFRRKTSSDPSTVPTYNVISDAYRNNENGKKYYINIALKNSETDYDFKVDIDFEYFKQLIKSTSEKSDARTRTKNPDVTYLQSFEVKLAGSDRKVVFKRSDNLNTNTSNKKRGDFCHLFFIFLSYL